MQPRDRTLGRLVVSRYAGESIFVGDDIEVELVEVVGSSKARIAITAPKDVRIMREELAR